MAFFSRDLIKGLGRTALVATVVTMSLTGCGLLSPVEVEHKVEIITEDISEKYDLYRVEKRDVELTDIISCTYSQMNEDNLSFKITDRQVKYVYVNEGDSVTEGQLLAKLDVDDLENTVEDLKDALEQTALLVRQQEELIDFYNRKLASKSISLVDKEEYRLKIQECNESIRKYNTQTELDNANLEETLQTIEDAKIYSLRDGTVSSLREDLVGSVIAAGARAITVIDTSACAFKARDPEAASYMKIGDSVRLEIDKAPNHYATVSELDKESGEIIFELDEPDFTIAVGTKGTIRIQRESKSQVLAVINTAIYSTDEFYYVYIINENGVRDICKIEVGLIGDNYTEIVSGLALNDNVILRKAK